MKISRGHVLLFVCLNAALLGIGEVMVSLLAPQSIMVPRYSFSEQYNTVLPPQTKIRHEKPGVFRYIYTVNKDGNRGPFVSPDSARNCVVVLGDSFSMGAGVDDGEEFPAQMQKTFGAERSVVNLGVGGWGLSQQIRRYYEFGERFRPTTVVLQFCSNDPLDIAIHPVTRWENGTFTFHPVRSGGKRFAKYLSNSPLQRSQLYNFVRNQIWLLARDSAAKATDQATSPNPERDDAMESAYVALLVPFAEALRRDGIELIFVSVENALDGYPKIEATVESLNRSNQLHRLRVETWLSDLVDYASPEGHAWGPRAHARIGEGIGRWITNKVPLRPDPSR